jgi:hypothetical protein
MYLCVFRIPGNSRRQLSKILSTSSIFSALIPTFNLFPGGTVLSGSYSEISPFAPPQNPSIQANNERIISDPVANNERTMSEGLLGEYLVLGKYYECIANVLRMYWEAWVSIG